jgi:hypothetical protein
MTENDKLEQTFGDRIERELEFDELEEALEHWIGRSGEHGMNVHVTLPPMARLAIMPDVVLEAVRLMEPSSARWRPWLRPEDDLRGNRLELRFRNEDGDLALVVEIHEELFLGAIESMELGAPELLIRLDDAMVFMSVRPF